MAVHRIPQGRGRAQEGEASYGLNEEALVASRLTSEFSGAQHFARPLEQNGGRDLGGARQLATEDVQ